MPYLLQYLIGCVILEVTALHWYNVGGGVKLVQAQSLRRRREGHLVAVLKMLTTFLNAF